MHLPSDMPYMVGLLMPSGDAKNAVIFYAVAERPGTPWTLPSSPNRKPNPPTFFFPAITGIENRKSRPTHHLSHQNRTAHDSSPS